MDPYKVLNIPKDAGDDEIKKAYRKLALEHHPDKGGDEDRFKQINEAYSILSDAGKRREYEASQQFGGGFNFSFGGFEDVFSSFFGGHRQSRSRPQEQTDEQIMFDFKISLAQIKNGLAQNIAFDRNKNPTRLLPINDINSTVRNSIMKFLFYFFQHMDFQNPLEDIL